MSATFSHAASRLGEIIEHVPAFHVHTAACRGCWPLGRGECIVQLGFRAAAASIMRETCCPLAWPPRPPHIFSHREPREISLFAGLANRSPSWVRKIARANCFEKHRKAADRIDQSPGFRFARKTYAFRREFLSTVQTGIVRTRSKDFPIAIFSFATLSLLVGNRLPRTRFYEPACVSFVSPVCACLFGFISFRAVDWTGCLAW